MPLYEYICRDCGETFEKMVRFSEDPDLTPSCPVCGSELTHKQLSTVASRGTTAQGTAGASDSSCAPSGRFS